jgi:glucose-6-phosphate 1-dehydrogenase
MITPDRNSPNDSNPNSSHRVPTILVIFGASGDLTKRKLIPALAELVGDGYLDSSFFVIGASRTKISDDEFRDQLWSAVSSHAVRPVERDVWDRFARNIFYQALDGTNPGDFAILREKMVGLLDNCLNPANFIYYLATAARHFVPIAQNLKSAGLVESSLQSPCKTRLVVEKPFGEDLASARELNVRLRESFAEEQIYRIDHYLGKETVQNILVMRFCNNVFEPLWNNRYVEQIQISVCEDIGVGSRADFFDKAGIARDIVQNHVMQMLSLLCIEPPLTLQNPNYIRDEKVKVLRAIRRISREEVAANSVRGRYGSGKVRGQPVIGYLEEKGVSPDSLAETFVALKFEINNWRWAGVPIYVRAGKRLPRRITQISVFFKQVPDSLMKNATGLDVAQNVLSIQVQPREGITLSLNSKLPGLKMRVQPVELDFSYVHSFAERSPDAYERLLLDAIKGDSTLFTRDDEIEEAWEVLAPFLEVWSNDANSIHEYAAGTWGPEEASRLLRMRGHAWQDLGGQVEDRDKKG